MSETSEVLRRAAGLMRERAEAATPGPWTSGPHFQRANCASVFAGRRTNAHYLAMYATTDDAAWMATMHPAVGLAVAEWLEMVADDCGFDVDPAYLATARDVARAVLGADQ